MYPGRRSSSARISRRLLPGDHEGRRAVQLRGVRGQRSVPRALVARVIPALPPFKGIGAAADLGSARFLRPVRAAQTVVSLRPGGSDASTGALRPTRAGSEIRGSRDRASTARAGRDLDGFPLPRSIGFRHVALQEPVLRAARLSFEWDLSPRFPEVRGAITEILRDATGSSQEWVWDSDEEVGPTVAAWNEKNQLFLIAGTRRLDCITESPDTPSIRDAAANSVQGCLAALNLDHLTGTMGAGTWMLAAEDSRQATEALEAWLFNESLRTTLQPLGGRPDDLIVSIRFDTGGDVTTSLRTEPLTDTQAAASPYFLSDAEPTDFPPASVIVEVERRQAEDCDPPQALSRAERHLEQVLAETERLLATVEVK